MTLLSPPFALGADGQKITGKLLRLAIGAAFPSSTTGGMVGVSGVLYGPPNTMGELTQPSNAVTRVQPFRAVIQCTQDLTAGQYIVANDAVVDLATPAQDASQWRRALVAVRVADSQAAGVASSPLTDGAWLEIQAGALAATSGAAALPATTPNTINLGELLIGPVGQPVTLTPYNPRTITRGGIMPVINDALTVAGHGGRAPSYDGDARWHPTYGLQLGKGGAWGPPVLAPARTALTLPGSLTGGTGSYAETPTVWKISDDEVRCTGIIANPAGWGTGVLTVATIPAGFRPPVDLVRGGTVGTSSTTGIFQRLNVRTNGIIEIVSTAAQAANAFLSWDFGWRLS